MLVVGGGKLLLGLGDILFGSFVIGVLEVCGVVGCGGCSEDFEGKVAGLWWSANRGTANAFPRLKDAVFLRDCGREMRRQPRICLWFVRSAGGAWY